MKASDIIYEVSLDLNDQVTSAEYTRWPVKQLQPYYQEALLELADAYRQLFTKTMVVSLSSGAGWQSACCCTHILRIIGESTEDGDIISYVQQRMDDNVYLWPGAVNSQCILQSIENSTPATGYSINKIQDNFFKVYPPVLPGQKRYVLLECYQEPDGSDLDFDVPNRLVQAIKQWMLYRALIVDAENNPAIAEIAKTHLTTYQSLLKELAFYSREQKESQDAGNNTVRAAQNSGTK